MSMPRILPMLSLLALLASCEEPNGVGGGPSLPSSIELEEGKSFDGSEPQAWQARVLDEKGRPVPGALVTFRFREFGTNPDVVHSDSARTDAAGVATVHTTLEGFGPERRVTVEAGVSEPKELSKTVVGVINFPAPARIVVDRERLDVLDTAHVALGASVFDARGKQVHIRVTWRSTDPTTGTVDGIGNVAARAWGSAQLIAATDFAGVPAIADSALLVVRPTVATIGLRSGVAYGTATAPGLVIGLAGVTPTQRLRVEAFDRWGNPAPGVAIEALILEGKATLPATRFVIDPPAYPGDRDRSIGEFPNVGAVDVDVGIPAELGFSKGVVRTLDSRQQVEFTVQTSRIRFVATPESLELTPGCLTRTVRADPILEPGGQSAFVVWNRSLLDAMWSVSDPDLLRLATPRSGGYNTRIVIASRTGTGAVYTTSPDAAPDTVAVRIVEPSAAASPCLPTP